GNARRSDGPAPRPRDTGRAPAGPTGALSIVTWPTSAIRREKIERRRPAAGDLPGAMVALPPRSC
ncbi:MAG: hypothetical protein AAFR52_20965, partial [Pseudomonadota bacterium]